MFYFICIFKLSKYTKKSKCKVLYKAQCNYAFIPLIKELLPWKFPDFIKCTNRLILCIMFYSSMPVINLELPISSKFIPQYRLCTNGLTWKHLSFAISTMLQLISRGRWGDNARGAGHFQIRCAGVFFFFLLPVTMRKNNIRWCWDPGMSPRH